MFTNKIVFRNAVSVTAKARGGRTLIKILTQNFYASSPVSIRLKLIRHDSVKKKNSLENILIITRANLDML